jgi:hypothetical protein
MNCATYSKESLEFTEHDGLGTVPVIVLEHELNELQGGRQICGQILHSSNKRKSVGTERFGGWRNLTVNRQSR